MFGYFEPADRATRRAMFPAQCGLCRRFGTEFRLRTRLMAGYDASLLLLVCDGLAEVAAPRAKVACPIPLAPKRMAIAADWPATEAVAKLQLFLAGQKIEDDRRDRERLRSHLAWRAYSREIEAAERWLVAAGFDVTEAKALLERQREREADLTADLDALAEGSAELMDRVVVFATATEAASHQIRRFARALGRLLYLIDALDDWADDRRRGSFNAVARAIGEPTPASVAFLVTIVECWSAELVSELQGLPLRRHREAIEATVRAFVARAPRYLTALAEAANHR
ncbi:MAG: hypothetical protein KC609_23160 [Myxococcales bacterium]|nr:hypothetical protein [Myxococcales bacterium]